MMSAAPGLAAGFALTLLGSGATFAPTFSAAEFVDSVGVNTHLHHAGSFYDLHFEQVAPRLLAARITHVRDGASDLDGRFYPRDGAERFAALGRAGIRVTFIFRPWVSREFVAGWPARVAPAFEAYEAPNEFNLQKAVPWSETLRAWLPRFAQFIRDTPAVSHYPVLGPSIADLGGEPQRQLGDLSTNFDFGNLHKYYRAYPVTNDGYGAPGTAPCDQFRYGQLDYALCQARRISANKPLICTEAGYGSAGTPGRELSPGLQARYVTRMLLLHYAAGVRRTFLYQLADSGDDGGAHFGLLTADGAEKPAYRQLAALLGELAGPPLAAAPGPLPFTVVPMPTALRAMSFKKRDGTHRIVLWQEVASVDPRTSAPLLVPAQAVRLTLPANYRATSVIGFDADGRPAPRAVAPIRSIDLDVTDNPTLVRVVPIARENP
jgi:hypothetical protein